MMRSVQNARQVRTPNTSQQVQKTKKMGLSNSQSKNKGAMITSLNSMNSSMKKSAIQSNSKSNKKITAIGTSNSNKSLKALKDITPNTNHFYDTKMIQSKRIQKQNKDSQKKSEGKTIPVKSIKDKICGKSGNNNSHANNIESKLNTTLTMKKVMDKQKQNQLNKQQTAQSKQNSSSKSSLKQYYFAKGCQNKKTMNSRQNITELLNFTSALTEQEQPKKSGLSLCQFEVGRKLGKGRFGDVYMAKDIKTGFCLAIKMINKKQLKQSDMQNQLVQQIKIQMYSNHPNILKMYGFFSDKHKIYLLLELATNGCLYRQIRNHGYFKQNLASFYFRQVTSGIRYLHSNCVIHRDIKPQNILNCFNVLKICDFGWSIYSPIYQRQTFCGTLDYVPPQIVTGDFYDQKADVWCLGVLCYQLCTGKAPFQSTTDENETYDKILKVKIEFPIYLSPQIVDFIGKILTRDPTQRLSLTDVQSHQWMRAYQNQSGRMISKEIWDNWIQLTKQ